MADEQLAYPTERVVGIVADRVDLAAINEQLRAAEVERDRIEVLCSAEANQGAGPEVEGDGPLGPSIRAVRTLLGDEAGRLQHLNEAIEAGSYVIQIALPPGDDDEREAAKQRIGQALIAAGASSVAFYGRWQVEELQLGA